jgi:hypothetical protein
MIINMVLLITPFVMFAAIGVAVSTGHSRSPVAIPTSQARQSRQRRYFSSPF